MHMTNKTIEIFNAEKRISAWLEYVARAQEANDVKREEYGLLRLSRANNRLKKLLRP